LIEQVPFVDVELVAERPDRAAESLLCLVRQPVPLAGQLEQDRAAVVGVGDPADVAEVLDPADDVGQRGRRQADDLGEP